MSTARARDDMRRRLIALAHIAAQQCGADDATRREVQRRVAGVDSCAQMDIAALQAVIRYWQRAGARVTLPGPLVRASDERAPLIGKIRALSDANGWPWPQYALGIVRHMLGHEVQRIEWVTAEVLRKVVAALVYAERRSARRTPPEKA
jgi:phage gp16-like protein